MNAAKSIGVLAPLAFLVSPAAAQVPNVFSSGDPALAAEVNENFSYLNGQVEDLTAQVNASDSGAQVFDMLEYDSFASGVFQLRYRDALHSDGRCDRFMEEFVTNEDGSLQLTSTVSDSAGGAVCSRNVVDIDTTGEWGEVTHSEFFRADEDGEGNALRIEQDWSNFITGRPTRRLGGSFGALVKSVGTNWTFGGEPIEALTEFRFIGNTLAATGSVTTPAGEWDNCLLFHELASNIAAGFNSPTRTYWQCPGVGNVKVIAEIKVDGEPRRAMWVLQSITRN